MATRMAEREHGDLISADKVTGTAVYNQAGENLGEVYSVMIDKLSGKVAYAVMSFGGFLGIGNRYHPLPWSMLHYDTSRGGYIVNIDKTTLEGAPSYGENETVDWSDPVYGKRLHDHYQVPPYWI
jgi:PRC-barrel domain